MCIKFCMTVWHKDIVTCWTHRDLEGPFFSIFKLLFTGKWTAQVFLSKLHSWGKLCSVISVGDTQAQSARTNNYCTEGRVVLMKPPHILTLLNPKVIEWGLFNIMYLYFVSIILCLSVYRHLFFLLQHYLLQRPCSVSKEELNPPPLASRTCISPSALRWKHQRQTVDGIGKKQHAMFVQITCFDLANGCIMLFWYKSSHSFIYLLGTKRLSTCSTQENVSNYTCQFSQ